MSHALLPHSALRKLRLVAPMHIFVTGAPGTGKSTLVARVLDAAAEQLPTLKAACVGFWTQESPRQHGERTGFDVCTMAGRQGVLARLGGRQGPCVGKYNVNVEGFEGLAIPELQRAAQPGSDVQLCVIDEVGKMELLCPRFFPAVLSVLDQGHVVVLGTIPVHDIPQVNIIKRRGDVQVFTVTRANRDQLVNTVRDALLEGLAHRRKPLP